MNHFVYLLQSKKDASIYVGYTTDVKERLQDHNTGSVRYTKSKRPWALVWYCVFQEKEKALAFEKYLKHGSGHAFARKRLL